jgi:hypothetical protein
MSAFGPACLKFWSDVAIDQPIAGITATPTIDRDAAQRFGIRP